MIKSGSLVAAITCVALFSFLPATAQAQEHTAEVIDSPPEAEEVSKELSALLSDKGIRVKRGESRTVAEIWLNKKLAIDPGFSANPTRLYPFQVGQFIGVMHFPRRGSDFRDQSISSGWYTLRFGLQPIDGNHVGTSPTRDFLLLVEAEQDEFPEVWEPDALNESSAEAAGSAHPAMICLQFASDGEAPAMRHDEGNDWWILHVLAKGIEGEQEKEIPIDMVVVGHATE